MSKQFKVGDKVKALRSALDIIEGAVYEVSSESCSEYVCIRDETGEENALLTKSEYQFVTGAKSFKAGDVLRTTDTWLAEHARAHGANPERLVVRSVDDRGYPVLTFEVGRETLGFDRDLFEFVEPATVYKVISTDYPDCAVWVDDFASVEEAEAAIVDLAESGRTFEIYSTVRTVHKTVKLTERTETIRELAEVK